MTHIDTAIVNVEVANAIIDVMQAFEKDPPEMDYIWPGFVAGTVGALIAPGATGKSFWAIEAAMSVACGTPSGDLLGLKPPRAGRVVYWAGEDPESVLIRRVHAIGQHLDRATRQAIAENLVLKPVMGMRLNIMDETLLVDMIKICAGARLVVLDTLTRFHHLDENSNSDMAYLVAQLEHIAACTGAAVLYLHHVSKGSARDGYADQQQAARGASSLIDNARWCGFVAKMTEDEAGRLSDRIHIHDRPPIGSDRRGFFVRFGTNKQNYGVPQADHWYERKSGGVLIPVDLVMATGVGAGASGAGTSTSKKGRGRGREHA